MRSQGLTRNDKAARAFRKDSSANTSVAEARTLQILDWAGICARASCALFHPNDRNGCGFSLYPYSRAPRNRNGRRPHCYPRRQFGDNWIPSSCFQLHQMAVNHSVGSLEPAGPPCSSCPTVSFLSPSRPDASQGTCIRSFDYNPCKFITHPGGIAVPSG